MTSLTNFRAHACLCQWSRHTSRTIIPLCHIVLKNACDETRAPVIYEATLCNLWSPYSVPCKVPLDFWMRLHASSRTSAWYTFRFADIKNFLKNANNGGRTQSDARNTVAPHMQISEITQRKLFVLWLEKWNRVPAFFPNSFQALTASIGYRH